MIPHALTHHRLRLSTLISSSLSTIFLTACLTFYRTTLAYDRDPYPYTSSYLTVWDELCFLALGSSIIWCSISLFCLSWTRTRTTVVHDLTTPQLARAYTDRGGGGGGGSLRTSKSRHVGRTLSPITRIVVDLLTWLAFAVFGPGFAFWLGLAAQWRIEGEGSACYNFDVITQACMKQFVAIAALEIVAFIFMGVSLTLHFTSFVYACCELDTRSKARRRAFKAGLGGGGAVDWVLLELADAKRPQVTE